MDSERHHQRARFCVVRDPERVAGAVGRYLDGRGQVPLLHCNGKAEAERGIVDYLRERNLTLETAPDDVLERLGVFLRELKEGFEGSSAHNFYQDLPNRDTSAPAAHGTISRREGRPLWHNTDAAR